MDGTRQDRAVCAMDGSMTQDEINDETNDDNYPSTPPTTTSPHQKSPIHTTGVRMR